MKTYIGQTVDVGDTVCFIKNALIKDDSTTARKCKGIGKIIAITEKTVKIHCSLSESENLQGCDFIMKNFDDIICKINT